MIINDDSMNSPIEKFVYLYMLPLLPASDCGRLLFDYAIYVDCNGRMSPAQEYLLQDLIKK